MKRVYFLLYFTGVMILFVNTACKKEIPVNGYTYVAINPPPSPPLPYLAVGVDANVNITLEGPINFAILSGHVYGMGSNNLIYLWKKISGPASYKIEKSDSLQTKVLNLERGTYLFELRATNSVGNYYADTMTLKVEDPTSSNRQIIFSNLEWQCALGCSIFLENIPAYIPVNSPFRIYILREFSATWELIVPDSKFPDGKYFYSIWKDYIDIWPYRDDYLLDKPEIKISF
ncbi:MAG: hypothetical protein ABIU11_00620 [Chitinophagaceae bacterium]